MRLYRHLLRLGVGVLSISISHFQFPMGWRRRGGGEGGGPGGEHGLLRLQASRLRGSDPVCDLRGKIEDPQSLHVPLPVETRLQPTACPRDWLHTVQEGADEGHLIRVKIRMKKLCDQVTIVIKGRFQIKKSKNVMELSI